MRRTSRVGAPESVLDEWVLRGLAGRARGVVRAGDLGVADPTSTQVWAQSQGRQGAKAIMSLLLGFPSQPASKSVLVHAHSGSRPLPHAQKLLHKRHTHLRPPSTLQTCNSPHTNALTHSHFPSQTRPRTITVSTLRHAAVHKLANITAHNPTHTQNTPCARNLTFIYTRASPIHLFHSSSSGHPTLDGRHFHCPV